MIYFWIQNTLKGRYNIGINWNKLKINVLPKTYSA